jgi:excisionase family DNA binding protein
MDGTKTHSQIEPLLLSSAKAAEVLNISRSMFYSLDSSGRIGPVAIKLGSRSLWSREELAEWVRADCPPRHEWQAKKK